MRLEYGSGSLGGAHQMLLRGASVTILSRAWPRVFPVGTEESCVTRVRQIDRKYFFRDAATQVRILQREQHFHAFVKIPWHPIGAAQVDFRMTGIFKIENSTVQIERNDLASGIYFWTVKDGEKIIATGKVAVE